MGLAPLHRGAYVSRLLHPGALWTPQWDSIPGILEGCVCVCVVGGSSRFFFYICELLWNRAETKVARTNSSMQQEDLPRCTQVQGKSPPCYLARSTCLLTLPSDGTGVMAMVCQLFLGQGPVTMAWWETTVPRAGGGSGFPLR